MKRHALVVVFLLLSFAVFLPMDSSFSAESSLTGKKVLIDAGHGGSDPGSTECPGLTEADANLDIANRLKILIEGDGGVGFLIRDGDYDMTNADRYNLANQVGGDVLVSIHLNGWYDHDLNYTQGLYAKYPKDYLFTSVVHDRLAAELGIDDGGVRQFASGVVLKSDMTATLQEAVFISSTEECARLADGSGDRQQEIATALYLGLIDWFDDPLEFEPGKREDPPQGY
jgi:N-acetylmuramoyl-L-alanine amidase